MTLNRWEEEAVREAAARVVHDRRPECTTAGSALGDLVPGGAYLAGVQGGPTGIWSPQACYAGDVLYRSSVALDVEASWKTSSHGPVLTSMSLPNPTHFPAIR